MTTPIRPGRGRGGIALLALIAYVPLLLSAPGRLPADTKLYLYLSPGRLLSQAPLTWDTSQFGGWVPHQVIAYLWPQGPWYWLFDVLGSPDWVAHRLWVGSILLIGALGVRWLARLLEHGTTVATVAGAVYMLSPYVLPYLSRTSAMLLPWAALGWIVGLTIRAATSSGSRWRHPAVLALVLLSCSAVNATAVLMIAPAPVLWLLDASLRGRITWRRATSTALRIGVMSIGVSAWWISMLRTQGRLGADVLGFSESLEATSFTTLATETLRGTGYWLFYIRDDAAFATSASQALMENPAVLALTYVLPLLGLLGLVLVRGSGRRWAATMLVVGMVLAVGVHPIDDPSPLMSGIAENSRGGLALALRSSARATPLVVLALSLGLASLLQHLDQRRRAAAPWSALAPITAVVVAIAAMPVVWTAGMVDPDLDRDQDPPAAWTDAAALLDGTSSERRVMQLPGAEFGAFEWGFTVDPPQPGLFERPFLTRDLLPLGSPSMMDLQYAFDDRVQEGTLDAASVAGVARLLAVDTIWLAGDIDLSRYGTTPPDEVAAVLDGAPGLGRPVDLGSTRTGSGIPRVRLVPISDPVDVTRVADRAVLVIGSGDGIIDSVAGGLLRGTEGVATSASVGDDASDTPWDAVILTDSNRDRAHHWRSSQDVTGMTGTGGPEPEVLSPDEGDARFDLDGTGRVQPAFAQTTAHLLAANGESVEIMATTYGRPFTHLPERRAAMAVDDDVSTAWSTAEGDDPVGEALVLSATGGSLRLLQPQTIAGSRVNRHITEVVIEISSVSSPGSIVVALDERSQGGDGQDVPLPADTEGVTIRITAVSAAPAGHTPSGVGFAELGLGLGTLAEVVRLPQIPSGVDVVDAVVLTRLRVGATQVGRTDPEPVLHREFNLPSTLDGALHVAVAPGTDEGCRDDLLMIDGQPLAIMVVDDAATTCDGEPLTLSAGRHRIDGTSSTVERVVIDSTPDVPSESASVTEVVTGRTTRNITIDGCPSGCWLVLGEGWNPAWVATADGVELGTPRPLSGGNGWWLPAGDSTRSVLLEWTGQSGVDRGLVVSGLAVGLCLVIVVRTRRARHTAASGRDLEPGTPLEPTRRCVAASGAVGVVIAALVTSPVDTAFAVAALVPAVILVRPRVAALLAWSGVGVACVALVGRQVVRAPVASPLWPLASERFHRPVLAAVVVIAAMVWADDSASEHPPTPPSP